ncbi:ABC transporter G family member 20-like [Oppia nitens]|uniref:ABC transporter G family member 20-like n=1 Tax=Oppia nitens TaxID=1686743 RepID=UPI0023DB7AC9|nr:ABC transporter G family member 20-like [Oppia nitens]
MTVPARKIYGLLGPSGCGKTSLLRCVVGIRAPDSGRITVFGKVPGRPDSGIPGPGLGYMPQEIALFTDFSIYETFQYFGRLYEIDLSKVNERTDQLISLLNLPNKHTFIKRLSGGQKRRVSLAMALIHSPPLLILDEPTVGVDPVLRQSIWSHMEMLCRELGLTIIITTQYIEEARSADIVSFMRNGKLLMERNPIQLLNAMNLPSLESVFLKLCQIESHDNDNNNGSIGTTTTTTGDNLDSVVSTGADNSIAVYDSNALELKVRTDSNLSPNIDSINHRISRTVRATPVQQLTNKSRFGFFRRVSALNWKNITGIRRNLSMLVIQFLMPSFQCLLNFTCLGPDPYDLPIAVYNPDSPAVMSALFLRSLSNVTFNLIPFDTLDAALDRVREGNAWAVISFAANYSRQMQTLAYEDSAVESIPKIGLYLDTTNYVISNTIQKELYLTYNRTALMMAELAGANISADGLPNPIAIEGIVYGVESPQMTEFMAPGLISMAIFFAAMALTAITLVLERKDGVFERTLVAGVKTFEFIVSQISTQLIVLAVQVLLSIITMFYILNIDSKGSIGLVYAITLIQGMCGMALGLVVSAFSENESQALAMSMASFLPVSIISGIFWPVEAMPSFMKPISYFGPQTLALDSMRYVISRGWDIYYLSVIYGLVAPAVWFVLLVIIAAIGFHNISFR